MAFYRHGDFIGATKKSRHNVTLPTALQYVLNKALLGNAGKQKTCAEGIPRLEMTYKVILM